MLHEVSGNHHVTHVDARANAPCDTRENDAIDAKRFNQDCGRGCGRHFSDFGKSQHHLVPQQVPAPKIPTGALDVDRIVQLLYQALLLLGQGAENGRGVQLLGAKLAPQNLADGRFG